MVCDDSQVIGTGRVSDEAIMAGEVRPRALRKRQSRMKRLIVRQKAVKALVSAPDAAAAADAVLAAAQRTYDDLAERLHVRSFLGPCPAEHCLARLRPGCHLSNPFSAAMGLFEIVLRSEYSTPNKTA